MVGSVRLSTKDLQQKTEPQLQKLLNQLNTKLGHIRRQLRAEPTEQKFQNACNLCEKQRAAVAAELSRRVQQREKTLSEVFYELAKSQLPAELFRRLQSAAAEKLQQASG